jgi:hypothetical protein
MGETGVGAVSVTVPEPPVEAEGAVGPTGTCRVGLEPLPHALINVDVRRIAGNSVSRSVVIDEPRYSSNNEPLVNLFIENPGLRLRYHTAVQQQGRGRPSKYGRPARAVTVTLPEDVLARLSKVHVDVGSAIVNLVEKSAPVRAIPVRPAELAHYGNRAVIVVTPSPTLRRLRGVQLVPVGNGRALISLSSSTSISSLELQVRDALERMAPKNREREVLQLLADILRRSRGTRGLASEARTIIVLASKAGRRVS